MKPFVLLRSLFKSIPFWLVVVALQIAFILPFLQGYYTMLEGWQYQYSPAVADAIGEGVGTAPPEIEELFEKEHQAFNAILEAETDKEWIDAVVAYNDVCRKSEESGLASSDASPELKQSIQIETELSRSLSELENPKLYNTVDEYPSLMYLGASIWYMPSIFWVLPGLLAGICVLQFFDKNKLLASWPVSDTGRMAHIIAVLVVLSLILIVLITAPALIATTVKNGLGDPSYPAVFKQGQQIIHLDIAKLVAREFVGFLLITVVVGVGTCFVFRLSRNALLSVAIVAAVSLLAPSPDIITNMLPAVTSLLPWIPLTYFQLPALTGHFEYMAVNDVMPLPGVSFELGIAVLGCTALILCLLCIIHNPLSSSYSKTKPAHFRRES